MIRRLSRRLFALAAGVSFVLCVGAVVLWWRSGRATDLVYWNRGGRQVQVASAAGRVTLIRIGGLDTGPARPTLVKESEADAAARRLAGPQPQWIVGEQRFIIVWEGVVGRLGPAERGRGTVGVVDLSVAPAASPSGNGLGDSRRGPGPRPASPPADPPLAWPSGLSGRNPGAAQTASKPPGAADGTAGAATLFPGELRLDPAAHGREPDASDRRVYISVAVGGGRSTFPITRSSGGLSVGAMATLTYKPYPSYPFDRWSTPYWPVVTATAVPPLLWFGPRLRRSWVRRRRRRMGLCLNCGYDLRAGGDRCQECGKAIGATGAAA